MLEAYPSNFMSDTTAIQVSRQRIALSRAICVELKQQVAESQRLLQQSRRTLAKSWAESQSGDRPPPERESRDPHRLFVPTSAVASFRWGGIPLDEWCDNEPGSQYFPYAHPIPSSRIENGASGGSSRAAPVREYWRARTTEIAFRIVSFALIVSIYAATALALWEAWEKF